MRFENLEEAQAYLDRILGARKGGRSDSRKIGPARTQCETDLRPTFMGTYRAFRFLFAPRIDQDHV